MIGNIGGKIGPAAVRLLHRAILVIPERGRAEQGLLPRLPIVGGLAFWRFQRARVDQPLGAQGLDRGLDLAGAIQRLFRRIDIHLDAKRRQILADHRHHHAGGKVAHIGQPDRFRLVQQAVAVFGFQGLADRDQIVAGIQTLGNFRRQAMRLAIAFKGAAGQDIDLPPAVVDVVFPRDVEPGIGQQRRQRIAHHGPPRMGDVHRPRGIGADELDHDLAALPKPRPAIACPGFQHRPHQPLPGRRL